MKNLTLLSCSQVELKVIRQKGMSSGEAYTVRGFVASGYESVRAIFEENYQLGSEEHSQLCVYVEGEKVVDLWGKFQQNSAFDGDSLINVFSSTKSITSIVMAMAKDKGWLDYSDKITKHWPEFGVAGKEEITIVDLMRHEAGLSTLPEPLNLQDMLPESIKKNQVGEKIAKMTATWPKDGKRAYHALSRGWIANEIFRRANPEKLTIGEFVEREVASKLDASLYIGCSKPNYYTCTHASQGYVLKESVKKSLGMKSGVEISIVNLLKMTYAFFQLKGLNSEIKDMKSALDLSGDGMREVEIPSANGNCSARGLALLGAAMANKGEHQGVQLLSLATWQEMHADATDGELFMGIRCPFTQGGIAEFPKGDVREGYYGWLGYGGSVFQWHPELKIGFAYTCTLLFPVS